EQVSWQPGDIKIESIAICEVHSTNKQEILALEQHAPGHTLGVTEMACINLIGADEPQFFSIDRTVLLRAISEPPVPDQLPYHADCAELHERQTPALPR